MAEFNDEYVVLLERTIQANKEVVSENQKLRDELRRRDCEHSRVLDEVLNELHQLKEKENTSVSTFKQSRARNQRRQRVNVPSACRRTLRHVFKTMSENVDFPGFFLDESVSSANNRNLMERVRDEIHHHVGGVDHCQWSNAQIEEAFRRYFLSTYELEEKKKSGMYEQHKQKCRRQGRIREKLSRRTLALELPCCTWDRRNKAEVASVLSEQFMSSEESEEEDGHVVYKVKRLAWESSRLSKRKHKLDKWFKNKSKGSRKHSVKRVRSDDVSQRDIPENCPEWACNH